MALAVEKFQAELEKAKESLNKVDENIKKITGRDPTETVQSRNARFRSNTENREGTNRIPVGFQGRLSSREDPDRKQENPLPNTKRIVREGVDGRPAPIIGNPRGWRNDDFEDGELPRKGGLHSSIAQPQADKKTREEVLAQQSKDVKVKERNRRMFGSLLGTLAKFRQEETTLKEKEEKRARIEQRLEENARQEKESLWKERNELFVERRRQQAHVRRLEWKMHRLREHDEWASRQQLLLKFIKTSSTPPIYYKPKVMTPKAEELLQQSQLKLKEMLELRRKELEEELVQVEERANARLENFRERGNQPSQIGEQDEELEEIEAEIEMYALALGDEEKEEERERNPAEVNQGPLNFPKTEPDDQPMDSA